MSWIWNSSYNFWAPDSQAKVSTEDKNLKINMFFFKKVWLYCAFRMMLKYHVLDMLVMAAGVFETSVKKWK